MILHFVPERLLSATAHYSFQGPYMFMIHPLTVLPLPTEALWIPVAHSRTEKRNPMTTYADTDPIHANVQALQTLAPKTNDCE